MTKILEKYTERGLLGGSDKPGHLESVVNQSDTKMTGTKISLEFGLERWLFELIGITKQFFRLSFEGPTTTTKSKPKKKFRAVRNAVVVKFYIYIMNK